MPWDEENPTVGSVLTELSKYQSPQSSDLPKREVINLDDTDDDDDDDEDVNEYLHRLDRLPPVFSTSTLWNSTSARPFHESVQSIIDSDPEVSPFESRDPPTPVSQFSLTPSSLSKSQSHEVDQTQFGFSPIVSVDPAERFKRFSNHKIQAAKPLRHTAPPPPNGIYMIWDTHAVMTRYESFCDGGKRSEKEIGHYIRYVAKMFNFIRIRNDMTTADLCRLRQQRVNHIFHP
jgi:hypothetical protein